jgi:hypothetical protein
MQWILNLKPAFGGYTVLTMVTIEQKKTLQKNLLAFNHH